SPTTARLLEMQVMNLSELRQKLIAAARANSPADSVPYAFEKRILARLTGRPEADPLDFWHAGFRAPRCSVWRRWSGSRPGRTSFPPAIRTRFRRMWKRHCSPQWTMLLPIIPSRNSSELLESHTGHAGHLWRWCDNRRAVGALHSRAGQCASREPAARHAGSHPLADAQS